MTTKEELRLLKEKVALLEKIVELEEKVSFYKVWREPVYIPTPYPTYPQPQPYNPPWIIYTTCTTEINCSH